MDPEIEWRVSEWKSAKERKDYATADQLRAELREAGFDPDKPRAGGAKRDATVERKMQQWQEAKRNKDYSTADRIRAELREEGVEMDPSTTGAGGGKNGGRNGPAAMGGLLPGFVAPFRAPMPSQPTVMYMVPELPKLPKRQYDPEVENEIDRWEEARSNKDYGSADEIRQGLRDRGISPAKERPKNAGPEVEIERWRAAKKAKDYERSDRIRESLRNQGVDPEKGAPATVPAGFGRDMGLIMPTFMTSPAVIPTHSKQSDRPGKSLSRMDATTIRELSEWYNAKDQKDFATSDSIREVLRTKGVEPEKCQRPGSAGLDEEMEEQVRQWFEAKDEKNWPVADAIREGLRASGVEPAHCERPLGTSGGGSFGKAASKNVPRSAPYASIGATSGAFDKSTEAQLDLWWKYKQDKKYKIADAVRAELRLQGIEPEHHRPRK